MKTKVIFQHRIQTQTIRRPNPVHISILLATWQAPLKVSIEERLGNFWQRPGQIRMDH